MTYEDHYIVGKWQDLTRYACKHDVFDTFDLATMKEHIDIAHGDNVPAPDILVVRRDRFGNDIVPLAAPEPVKVPPAPKSKEVPDSWDPHASHEERGMKTPPLNAAAKAALKKATAPVKARRAVGKGGR